MDRVVKIIFLLMLAGFSQAQTYNLQQAIDTAIARNIPIKQSDLLMQAAGVNWKQSRLNRLPDLNSDINHGINQGRSIDPFTNAPVTQQINYAGFCSKYTQKIVHKNYYLCSWYQHTHSTKYIML